MTAAPSAKTKVTRVRRELAFQISEDLGMSQTAVRAVVNRLLELCMTSLEANERIELRGFGVFDSRIRQPRMIRNPKTGEQRQSAASVVTTFKPSVLLTQRLNASQLPSPTDTDNV